MGSKNYETLNIDLYPTLLDILGIQQPDNLALDCQNFLPVLKGEEMDERPLFWHFPIYLENGNKETQDPIFRTRPESAVILGN